MESKELIEKLNNLITEQGIKVSGNGIIIEHLAKIAEKLDKIDTKLYFLEKRDKEYKELHK